MELHDLNEATDTVTMATAVQLSVDGCVHARVGAPHLLLS
jgi:hypothetical protein